MKKGALFSLLSLLVMTSACGWWRKPAPIQPAPVPAGYAQGDYYAGTPAPVEGPYVEDQYAGQGAVAEGPYAENQYIDQAPVVEGQQGYAYGEPIAQQPLNQELEAQQDLDQNLRIQQEYQEPVAQNIAADSEVDDYLK